MYIIHTSKGDVIFSKYDLEENMVYESMGKETYFFKYSVEKKFPQLFTQGYNEVIVDLTDMFVHIETNHADSAEYKIFEVLSYREIFWHFKQSMLNSMKTCYGNRHIIDDEKALEDGFESIVKSLLKESNDWVGFKNF